MDGTRWQVKGHVIVPGAAWLEMALGAAMTLNEAQHSLSPLLHKGSFVAALTLPSLGSRAILAAKVDPSSAAIFISSGATKPSDGGRKLTHFSATVQSALKLSDKTGRGLPLHGSGRPRKVAGDALRCRPLQS